MFLTFPYAPTITLLIDFGSNGLLHLKFLLSLHDMSLMSIFFFYNMYKKMNLYCVKCKTKTPTKDLVEVTTKNGRLMMII